MAHGAIDMAVMDAYGIPETVGDAEILAHLLELNLARSEGAPLAAMTAE